jgi:hypothetical protein
MSVFVSGVWPCATRLHIDVLHKHIEWHRYFFCLIPYRCFTLVSMDRHFDGGSGTKEYFNVCADILILPITNLINSNTAVLHCSPLRVIAICDLLALATTVDNGSSHSHLAEQMLQGLTH